MSKLLIKKILDHPDKDAIISRLVTGESAKEVSEWLKSRYINASETKFALSVDFIKTFQDKYLDVYVHIREDILATKSINIEVQLDTRIKTNKKYKERLAELAGQEIDIKKTIKMLVAAIEARAEQVFDHLQENDKDFKVDNVLIQYFNTLMTAVEKCNKIVNDSPDQVIQHNHIVQLENQQMAIFVETVKDIIRTFDYEKSLMFVEMYQERIGVLNPPEEFKPVAAEIRLAEVKLLNEKVNT